MKIIGITGGVGSGKSQVLSILENICRCRIIKADDVARKLQGKGEKCYAELVILLGKEALSADGELDRAYVARLIFKDEELRRKVDAIVHPYVKKEIIEEIKQAEQAGYDWAFIEAALLLEDNYDEICDEIWYVYATRRIRAKRLKSTRGYSEEKIKDIMGRQLSEAQFRRRCDRVVDNGGTLEDTEKRLIRLVKKGDNYG